jgi:hypothetical protein
LIHCDILSPLSLLILLKDFYPIIKDMDTSIFSDPTKIGPGIWFKIHIDAKSAVTDLLKQAFIVNINALCDNFKCKKCQPHFRKFIDTHPLKDYWNIKNSNGADIGFFKWSWELHNQVNKFLDKYQPTLEEAYAFYSDSEAGACFNCGADAKPSNVPELRTRAIPEILSLYREKGDLQPKPFKLISISETK